MSPDPAPIDRYEAFAMDAEGYDVPVGSCKACGLREVNGLVGPCIDHGVNPRPWEAPTTPDTEAVRDWREFEEGT